jgi:hypothetical protein
MTEHHYRRKTTATSAATNVAPSSSSIRIGEAWESLPDIYGLEEMYGPLSVEAELTVELLSTQRPKYPRQELTSSNFGRCEWNFGDLGHDTN